jgi:hypothetical protein
LVAPNWLLHNGRLEWIVFREPVTPDSGPGEDGYYLLVREGHESKRLGSRFKEGGWWKYDPDKALLPQAAGHQRWESALAGQIPVWVHYGHKGRGTTQRAAMSRSSTYELGQIAVSLMNVIHARDYDYWKACSSELFFLGANPNVMDEIAKQKGNIYKGVPLAEGGPVGEGQRVAIHDASMGAVTAQVSESIVKAKFAEAREQSYQQVTSTPDSSGRSKEAGYQEQKAPYLATRAALMQQSENTLLYFWELRSGFSSPAGYSLWPREFDLAPLVDDIDATFDTLKRSGLRSPTAEAMMMLAAMRERGVIVNPTKEKDIESELEDSAQAAADRASQTRDLLGGLGDGDNEPPSARRIPRDVPGT